MLGHCARVAPVVLKVNAPVTDVWRVIGERWGDVHRIIPSLSASRLLTDGPLGSGSRRSCTLAKPVMGMETVEERVESWDAGRAFTYVFDAPPWPMASVSNRWSLEPDGDGTRLTLTPSLVMRGGAWTQWLAPLMLRLMSRSLQADIPLIGEAIERECAAPQ